MRILIVEDSKRLQRGLGTGLRKMGYAVDVTGDGEEGLWLAQSNEYDAIVLDLMLPGIDGLTILQRLREGGKNTHILILTAKDTLEDRVRGLQQGADDYLTKPFAFEELLARLQALLRRKYENKNPRIQIGNIRINTVAKSVKREGKDLDLAPREYALLEFLALRSGQLVSRSEIETHIYDESEEVMSNVVDSAICKLRKKINTFGEPNLIQTRRGEGYILREEIS